MHSESREMPVVLLLLLVAFTDVVVDAAAEEQQSSRLTVNPNAMWIAAVASGFGMMVVLIVILLASTFLLRRYERKRVMMLAPMLARLQAPNDDPRQGTASGPPGSVNREGTNRDALSVTAVQPLGVANVYYNRGLDVDETEAEATHHLDPKPFEIVASRRLSAGQEISVL